MNNIISFFIDIKCTRAMQDNVQRIKVAIVHQQQHQCMYQLLIGTPSYITKNEIAVKLPVLISSVNY